MNFKSQFQKTVFSAVLLTMVASPVLAVSVDQNAELKAEFAKDLPIGYGDAIKNTTNGAITATASLGAETKSSSEPVTVLQSDSDTVRIVYKGHALLFGFLPTPIDIEISVNSNGQSYVALPWYRFLLKTEDTTSAEGSINTAIQLKTTLPTPDATLSEYQQELVVSILKETVLLHFTKSGLSSI